MQEIEAACNAVTIMEDNDKIAKGFSDHFTKNKFYVTRVNNLEEVLEELVNYDCTVPNFILDINMGEGRETEGLDVLKEIRRRTSNAFVVLYTAYEQHRKEAEKFEVNLFMEKRFDFKSDLEYLRIQMLIHNERVFKENLQNVTSMLDADENEAAFLEKLKNKKWRNENQGNCVAFLKGKLIQNKKMDKIDFVKEIREKFPGQPIMVSKIGEKKKIKKIRSPRFVKNG
jgi:CheY-like chemotaxis protein